MQLGMGIYVYLDTMSAQGLTEDGTVLHSIHRGTEYVI